MFRILLLSAFSILAMGQNACQLCPAGSTMQAPNSLIPLSNYTCQSLDNVFKTLPNQTECGMLLSIYTSVFDLQNFCGCSGVAAPTVCSFCASTATPDRLLPEFPNVTCSEFVTFAPFITNSSYCNQEMVSICCNTSQPAVGTSRPAISPTTIPGKRPMQMPSLAPTPKSVGTTSAGSATIASSFAFLIAPFCVLLVL